MESARLAGDAQAWRSPSHDKGASSGACYLGVRPLSLTMAFRPHPALVKLKYGITLTPLRGETQAWNPSDLVGTRTSPPRIQYWLGIATRRKVNTILAWNSHPAIGKYNTGMK